MLTIYTRPGCHLCDEMKETVSRVARGASPPVTVSEIDISSDPALEHQYGLEIPVLTMNGRKVAKYRVTAQQLTRMLEGAGPKA